MNAPAGSAPASTAETGNRIVAALIDFLAVALMTIVLAATLGLVGTFLSALTVAAYLALRDGHPQGSLGKRLLGLRVVGPGGRPVTYNDSIRRNLIFALPEVLGFAPTLTALAALLIIAAVISELVLVLTRPDGRRLGDQWAGTRVIASGAPERIGEILTPPTGRACTVCGAVVSQGQAFCGQCGAPLASPAPRVCPSCQAPITGRERFCTRCGQALSGS